MIYKVFAILFVANLISICSSAEFLKSKRVYPYVYKSETKHMYRVHTEKKSWVDARATCKKEGGLLFYPENRAEAEMVKKLFEEMTGIFLEKEDANLFHIGLTDDKDEGTFVTVDGRPISEVYNKWAPGEPNDGDHQQNCVQLINNLNIDDSPCDVIQGSTYNYLYVTPFVCKRKPCKRAKRKYVFSPLTESCYAFRDLPLNWEEANITCTIEDSHLAVINSEVEAAVLVELNAEKAPDFVDTVYLKGVVHLGFHKNAYGWETVTGKSLEDSGYTYWGYKQPDGGDEEQCGSMFPSGRLNDVRCDAKCFFICESSPF